MKQITTTLFFLTWNATMCHDVPETLEISPPALPHPINLQAPKGQNFDSVPGDARCSLFSTHTHKKTPRCSQRLITCAWKTFCVKGPFEKPQLCSVTSPQTGAQVPLHVFFFKFFMWLPNNLGSPAVSHKTLREPSLQHRFDGWNDRWADRWLHR